MPIYQYQVPPQSYPAPQAQGQPLARQVQPRQQAPARTTGGSGRYLPAMPDMLQAPEAPSFGAGTAVASNGGRGQTVIRGQSPDGVRERDGAQYAGRFAVGGGVSYTGAGS